MEANVNKDYNRNYNMDTSDLDIDNIHKEKEFLECLGNAAFIVYKGLIVVANNYTLQFTGFSEVKSILGQAIDEIIVACNSSKKILTEISNQIRNGNEFSSVQITIYDSNKEKANVKISASNHIFKGKLATIVVISNAMPNKESSKIFEEDDMYIPVANKDIVRGKNKYRDIIKLLPEAFFLVHQGKFLDMNDAGLKLLEIDELEEINNSSIYDFIHPEDIPFVLKKRELLYKNKGIPIPTECRIKKKDGSTVYIEITATSFDTIDGLVIIIMARDITLRKLIANFLKESEERYSTLVEFLPDTILINDEERILFVNNAGVRLFGEPNKGTIIGKKALDIIGSKKNDIYIRELVSKLFSNKMRQSVMEQKIISKNGNELDLEIASTPIAYNNQKAFLNVIRDITERRKSEENVKKLEQALENDKLKTEFFSNISHELKTPLNIILGTIQLLRDRAQNDNPCTKYQSQKRYLSTMHQNCNRLLRLINNLIDITRLDVGFLEMNFCNHNIVQVVEDITLSVAEYIESKGISLVFDTEIEEKVIACDIEKMERIMLNLLSNAVKFTDKNGDIRVNISTKKNKVVISVKDTGIGIKKDMLDKIFDRFKQASPLFTRSHEGSGIGLSLVKSLVEAHNGKIITKSTYGKGSEFIIELPVVTIDGEDVIESVNENEFNKDEKVERINIEFSDIYTLN